ncbi:MAG: DUF5615 family PIN-like protein [Gammaproteobacteria bacterium]|nr:DUF5615 family PIN-like protein [Gammaproteobacteria bacterium]MDE0507314.1 DUF5615 family PIN-like protein [Gammaproteobacteria bacterium]MXX07082.1 hypothetical protein [Gammaproteobacteria bacterium]MYC58574.1 hypothetical protein [Gammaproteobacteria bacterium]MYE30012.1 hypothetical protein [Gammaproteobacteria bacterium]
MKFIANENFPAPSVLALRELGHDVISASELCPGAPDSHILKIAHEEARVVITFDRDYGTLIFQRRLPPPAGVLYLRFRATSSRDPAYYVTRLLALGLELTGKFTTGGRNRVRQRPLRPLPD